MRKYFAYAFKKKLWMLVLLTVVCALPYMVCTATMDMAYTWTDYDTGVEHFHIVSPQLFFMAAEMVALVYFVPILTYSFKMKKRSVDCYYALPLKKEKLYLAETLTGLCLVAIPFTVAYWGGFLALLVRPENPYQMFYYLPAYFGMLGFGLLLYGFNSFIFTRANTAADGVVFMLAYAFVGFLLASLLDALLRDEMIPYDVCAAFVPPAGMISFQENMEWLIRGNPLNVEWRIESFLMPILYGVLGYLALFFALRFERAENAEQVSESWFGYKTLIPVYTAGLMGFCGIDGILLMCIIAVGAIVATVAYRRKFRFRVWDWGMLGGSFLVGIVLALIMG